MTQCDSQISVTLDDKWHQTHRCSLESGHEDAHAYIEDDVEHVIWVTDGNYSGPRAARLIRTEIDTRFPPGKETE